jgi:hypothetical protein
MGLGWQDKKKALWQSLPGLGPEVVGQNLCAAPGAGRRQGIVGETRLIQSPFSGLTIPPAEKGVHVSAERGTVLQHQLDLRALFLNGVAPTVPRLPAL